MISRAWARTGGHSALPVATSHAPIVPSRLAETATPLDAPGTTATALTQSSWAPRPTRRRAAPPPRASTARRVRSRLAETTRRSPPRLAASTAVTLRPCPCSGAQSGVPVAKSITRIVPRSSPVTTMAPPPSPPTRHAVSSAPPRRCERPVRGETVRRDLPGEQRTVAPGRDRHVAVGQPRRSDRGDRAPMRARDRAETPVVVQPPEAQAPVRRAADGKRAVGRGRGGERGHAGKRARRQAFRAPSRGAGPRTAPAPDAWPETPTTVPARAATASSRPSRPRARAPAPPASRPSRAATAVPCRPGPPTRRPGAVPFGRGGERGDAGAVRRAQLARQRARGEVPRFDAPRRVAGDRDGHPVEARRDERGDHRRPLREDLVRGVGLPAHPVGRPRLGAGVEQGSGERRKIVLEGREAQVGRAQRRLGAVRPFQTVS